MPSYQRRRGQEGKFWPTKVVSDNRGNKTVVPDFTVPPYVRRCAEFSDRSSRAEVPGQQQINVIKLITYHDMPDVGLWSVVLWRDDYWDIISPPEYHHGTRGTRHTSYMIRRRPVDDNFNPVGGENSGDVDP